MHDLSPGRAHGRNGRHRGVSREFDRLEGRLNEQLVGRLQQERDPEKRTLIFAFSQQLAALKEVVDGFLRDVFQPSRYEEHLLVRGVYFTS